ncbi:MAG TPA: hypothetical protein VMG59_01980 [Phycisphaerae bacterium]|nr:hypothetical protein [Phycisphaerae bacterium]
MMRLRFRKNEVDKANENKLGLFAIIMLVLCFLGFILYHQMLTQPVRYITNGLMYTCAFASLLGTLAIGGARLLSGTVLSSWDSYSSPNLKLYRTLKFVFLFLQAICISAFACDVYRSFINSNIYSLLCDIIIIATLLFLCQQASSGVKKTVLLASMGFSLVMFLFSLLGTFANLHPNGPFAANSKSIFLLICFEAAVFLCAFISLILRYREIHNGPQQFG